MPAFACLARADAIETWRDDEGRVRQLRYLRTGTGHRVIADREGTPFPWTSTYRRIEDARAAWSDLRRVLRGSGFRRTATAVNSGARGK